MKRHDKNWASGLLTYLFLLVLGVVAVRYILGSERAGPSLPDKEGHRAGTWNDGVDDGAFRGDEAEDEPAPQMVRTFVFDPNRADSLTLLQLGLKPWQIRAMMHYRCAGGRWQSRDDFARLYGLSQADYLRLRPYIRISAQGIQTAGGQSGRRTGTGPEPACTLCGQAGKYAEGMRLDVNACDTAELMKIPGIGPYYARKIVDYRTRLGGFVSLSQLNEIEDLPSGMSRWFRLPIHVRVNRLAVNTAGFKELVRHPYLSYEQAKVLIMHRSRYGPVRCLSDLKAYREFTDKDLKRLKYYLLFAGSQGD